ISIMHRQGNFKAVLRAAVACGARGVPALITRRKMRIALAVAEFPERGMRTQVIDLRFHLARFAAEKIRNRRLKAGIREPVGGESLRRQVAARKLVRPLCARFDTLQPMFDGVVDGAVVAGFEMQKAVILDAAPVAAIEAVAAFKIKCARDIAPVAGDHHQYDLIGEISAKQAEKFAVEIGRAPFAASGIHVESEKRIPVMLANLRAAQYLELESGLHCPGAFLPDRLAFARRKLA